MGIPSAYEKFLSELEKHLPWSETKEGICSDNKDWFVNLQVEGTTAVWASVEGLALLQQLRTAKESDPENFEDLLGNFAETSNIPSSICHRNLVATAKNSYHGPKTTALGMQAKRRWPGAPKTIGKEV